MIDRKIFVIILLLLLMLVISLNKNEHFSNSDNSKIKELEEMITNLNNSFKSTVDLFSNQKFRGFKGPPGDRGEQGPAGSENIVYQQLVNLSKPNKYVAVSAGKGKNASAAYMSSKPNKNSEFANFTQQFQYTKDLQLRPKYNNELCLTYNEEDIFIDKCDENGNNSQKWKFNKNMMSPYSDLGQCVSLSVEGKNSLIQPIGNEKIFNEAGIEKLITVPCDENNTPAIQQWSLI